MRVWMTVALLAVTGSACMCDVRAFETVGLFIVRGRPEPSDFWKACGYNMIQFVDEGFGAKTEDALDAYYRSLATNVRHAKERGFRTGVILLSNLPQARPYGETFDPTDEPAMQSRLAYIRKAVRALRDTDRFTFFAGDPGGVPKGMGPRGVQEWIRMAQRVKAIVREEAPKAGFNVNTWAIAYWGSANVSAFKADFWVEELRDTRTVLHDPALGGPDCGIELPPHNYYRSLALKALDAAHIAPERYPLAKDVRALRSRGVPRVWAWPHFLIDEGDDGYTRATGERANPAQSETRYVYRLVREMRKIGMDGIVTCAGPKSFHEALNIYAFGRFCADARASPEKVIDEYASYLADDSSRRHLAQVLRFLENRSTWQASLPAQHRLRDLACRPASAGQAIALLNQVTVRSHTAFPLPEPPLAYLKRLRERLDDLAAGERPSPR